jgi:TetR/AcrR family acrAB operon transcriptional repressor
MKRTKEEAEQTRKNLLNAALAIFSRKGFESTRLEDIAQAAGVTRGAIYHHFGGKEELFIALLDDASAISNKAIQQAVKEGGSLLQMLSRIIVYTFNLLEDDNRFRQVMALSISTTNLEELAKRKYKEAEDLVENISQALTGGVDSGELRPDLDPKNAARALLAYQNGLAMLWFSNRDVFSVKDNAEALAQIYLYGIART